MHDAFQVTTVVDKLTRIESIFAHGKTNNFFEITDERKNTNTLFIR
jgi:hypothetical protein